MMLIPLWYRRCARDLLTRASRSGGARSLRGAALLVTVALLACASDRSDTSETKRSRSPVNVELATVHRVLLEAPPLHPIVAPFRVDVASNGSYYIADRSERALWVYDSSGRYERRIAGAGYGPGRLQTLYGAALIRDTVALYDFNTASLSLYDTTGAFIKAVTLESQPRERPRRISVVGDSLLLVSRFPSQQPSRALLTITTVTGQEVTRIAFAADYYRRNPPLVAALTPPLADAGDGIVVAGITGHDSLFVYGYDGRRIAAGRITLDKGPRITDYETIARASRDPLSLVRLPTISDSLRQAGSFALAAIAVVDSAHAVLQLEPTASADSDPSVLPDSVWLVPVAIDRGAGQLFFGQPIRSGGRLVGHIERRAALLIDTGRADGQAELSAITVQAASPTVVLP